jgi:hypothetical protein
MGFDHLTNLAGFPTEGMGLQGSERGFGVVSGYDCDELALIGNV